MAHRNFYSYDVGIGLKENAELRKKAEEDREKAVARQVRAGLTDAKIGLVLHMNATHVAKIREKLGLKKNDPGAMDR